MQRNPASTGPARQRATQAHTRHLRRRHRHARMPELRWADNGDGGHWAGAATQQR